MFKKSSLIPPLEFKTHTIDNAQIVRSIFVSFLCAIVSLSFVNLFLEESPSSATAEFASILVVTIAMIPLISKACSLASSQGLSLLVFFWWPICVLYLWFGVSNVEMATGADNPIWHSLYGLRMSEYWANGGDLFPPVNFLYTNSIRYPAAIYLIGGPYHFFGPFPKVVAPWLYLFQLLSAMMTYLLLRQVGLSQKAAFFGLLYFLFAWIIEPLNLGRDLLLIAGLLSFVCGTNYIFLEKRPLLGVFFLLLGASVVYGTRWQYFVLLAVFTFLIGLSANHQGTRGTEKSRRTTLKVIGLVVMLFVLATFVATRSGLIEASFGQEYQRQIVNQFTIGDGSASGGLLDNFGRGSLLMLPIIIPVRLVASAVSPFPWYKDVFWDDFGLVFMLVHMAFSIISLSLLWIVSVRVWRMLRAGRKSELLSPRACVAYLGIALLLSAIAYQVSFKRYLMPAFPFLAAFFADEIAVPKKRFKALYVGTMAVLLLHCLYVLLR